MSDQPRQKQAACLVCRRSKIKCDWLPYEARCRRCIHLDCECVRPEFHPGRQKGIKNKRVGLEKALYQIQQAVKRVKSGDSRGTDDENVVANLRHILDDADGSEIDMSENLSSRQASQSVVHDGEGSVSSSDEADGGDSNDHGSMSDFVQRTEESLAIDGAENPLQLLARASYFQPPSERRSRQSPQNPRQKDSPGKQSHEYSKTRKFFSQPRVKLDIGEELDPVDLGLITMEETDHLFTFFHAKLAHTRWGLDSTMYTPEFTRSRSAFLFTSVLAASTLFMPSEGALSKRLINHVKTLAHKVIIHRYKSVEIVLAFILNVPWMFPGEHSTDDETCLYVSMATTIAFDLSLHKSLISSEVFESGSVTGVSKGECLDPQIALEIDGYHDVDPWSEKGRLILRGRERCFISLFVVERGMCLARGRPFMVPITRFIKDCENWHRSPLADPQDGHVTSIAVLRRNLDSLFGTVRALCDGSQVVNSDGSLVAQSIQSSIERFFDQWHTEWGVMIGTGPERRLPPYVEILVAHTRLSIYGRIINHPTAPVEVRRFFRTAGLSAALNVMRAAIQGEAQLQSMPNNTAIMISFAACFALTLSAYATDGSSLVPSIRNLIEEAAGVLERNGTMTKHRNGLAVLYGEQLRLLLKKTAHVHGNGLTASSPEAMLSTEPVPVRPPVPPPAHFMDQQLLWPETLQLSSMSDDQIAQVLNQPGSVFEPSFGGLSWEDMNNFDWLSYPAFSAG
ncbi:Satratoxin biosynthesis SC1 cluster transcription factor SAT9 [Cladobotryum mycophilum]|uniref:Satratoxin biosynthesis SC1 cluster transcription factor SAT9 n=1 Tax=Cladobotryum mycophilum TaxID=491253 RepID=A0ABR0SVX3_9HYPO